LDKAGKLPELSQPWSEILFIIVEGWHAIKGYGKANPSNCVGHLFFFFYHSADGTMDRYA